MNSFTTLVGAKDGGKSRETEKIDLENVYSDYSHFLRSFGLMGIKEMGQQCWGVWAQTGVFFRMREITCLERFGR